MDVPIHVDLVESVCVGTPNLHMMIISGRIISIVADTTPAGHYRPVMSSSVRMVWCVRAATMGPPSHAETPD